jgi:hypothetical protein
MDILVMAPADATEEVQRAVLPAQAISVFARRVFHHAASLPFDESN